MPISQLNSCNYERLVNKANSIEEDIKGMPILEQIKYAATPYQKINEVMGDMNVFIKAQTKEECVWRCLAAEYKGAMVKELEKRVQRPPIAVSSRRCGMKALRLYMVHMDLRRECSAILEPEYQD